MQRLRVPAGQEATLTRLFYWPDRYGQMQQRETDIVTGRRIAEPQLATDSFGKGSSMRRTMMAVWTVAVVTIVATMCSGAQEGETAAQETDVLNPWCGKYCMSFFVRARTAKTVGKGQLSTSIKIQHFDCSKWIDTIEEKEMAASPELDSFEPVAAEKIRIYFTSAPSDTPSLWEFEVYNTGQPKKPATLKQN